MTLQLKHFNSSNNSILFLLFPENIAQMVTF